MKKVVIFTLALAWVLTRFTMQAPVPAIPSPCNPAVATTYWTPTPSPTPPVDDGECQHEHCGFTP